MLFSSKTNAIPSKRMTGQANFASATKHIDQTPEHEGIIISGLSFVP
jgi:phosphohistidine swiveling domain-containing protein